MKPISKFLAGSAALVAAPAAAQFYPGFPGYGSPGYGYPGYGYPGYGGGYGYNVPGGSRIAVNQCSAAVQQRLGGNGYGYGGGYGRAVNVSSVEIAAGGGYRVRGVAAAPGYGYAGGNIGFSCRTDPRGFVVNVDVNNGYYGNGYDGNGYGSDMYNPYSAYGYQRY